MKKIVILFAAAMLLLAGCRVDMRDGYTVPTRLNVTATAVAVTDESRSYTPQWQADDRITVEYEGKTYVYYAKSSGSEVEFRPEDESLPINPTGPVSAWSNVNDGVFSISSDQTGLNFPMYAYNPSPVIKYMLIPMTFNPLASILALTIAKKEGEEVSSVSLKPLDDAVVTGSLSATEMQVNPATGIVSSTGSTVMSNMVSMDVGSLDMTFDQTLLFIIPNGTVIDGGMSVTITCSDGTSYTNNIFLGERVEFDCSYLTASTNLYTGISVSSYDDMLEFANRCAEGDGELNVDLLTDIDMQNEAWTPITGFKGAFNGYGHNIYNINVSCDDIYAGLFGYSEGTITRVNFGTKDGESYDGMSRIELSYTGDETAYAGIVARTNNTISDVNSFVPVTVSTSANCAAFAGGIVGGISDGSISGCANYGKVCNLMTAGSGGAAGGVVGELDSELAMNPVTVDDCHNYATVTTAANFADNSIGGIVGLIQSTALTPSVSNCTNSGEVYCDNSSATSQHIAGGIVGNIPSPGPSNGTITACSNSGKIHSNMGGITYIGGLVGLMYGIGVSDCSNSGSISYDASATTSNSSIGGLFGYVRNGNSIQNCENTGDVSSVRPAVNYVGGIVGYMYEGGTVAYCTNRGYISVVYDSSMSGKIGIGGILGYGYGSSSNSGPSIVECYNYGTIDSSINTSGNAPGGGGIIGLCTALTITDCVNEGTVTMTNSYASKGYAIVGGIFGDDVSPAGSVSGCVNRGTIIGDASYGCEVGGIAGRARYHTVTESKNFGSITSSIAQYTGSLIGFINGNSLTDSLSGGIVNDEVVNEESYETLAIGSGSSNYTMTGIYFGTDD